MNSEKDQDFFLNQVKQYNQLVSFLKSENVSFNICQKSLLQKPIVLIFNSGEKPLLFFNHPFLTTCFHNQLKYAVCVTFPSKVHICDFFLVMLGSDLDIQMLHNLYLDQIHLIKNLEDCFGTFNGETCENVKKNIRCNCTMNMLKTKPPSFEFTNFENFNSSQMYHPKYISNIYGYFFNKHLCFLPTLMVNNRVSCHYLKNGHCVYIEEDSGASFKLTLDVKDTLVCRTPKGENEDFSALQKGNFASLYPHVNFTDEKLIKKLMRSTFSENIDDIQNKIFITPALLLYKLVKLASVNKKQAKSIVDSGRFSTLLSKTLISNDYCYPLANHIGRRSMFNICIKNIGPNVKNSIPVPVSSEGFLSLLKINTPVRSFSKVFSLCPDIEFPPIEKFTDTLNKIINYSLKTGLIKRINEKEKSKIKVKRSDKQRYLNSIKNINTEKLLQTCKRTIRPILAINKVYPINYKLNCKFMKFYIMLKLKFPHIEIINKDEKIVQINFFQGILTKPYHNLKITPAELKLYFPFYRNDENFIWKENDHTDFYAYIHIPKYIHVNGFWKNRASGIGNLPFFTLCIENTNIHILNSHVIEKKKRNKEKINRLSYSKNTFDDVTSLMSLPQIFSSDPQLTADGYVIPLEGLGTEYIQAYNFRAEIKHDVNMKFKFWNPKPYRIIENGNVSKLRFDIGLVHSKNFKMYQFSKLSSVPYNSNNEHLIFLTLDFEILLQPRFYSWINSNNGTNIFHCQTTVTKTQLYNKIVVELTIFAALRFYNGLKLNNKSLQKGVCVEMDIGKKLPHLKGTAPLVIGSLNSVLTREPWNQLKSMVMNPKKTRYGKEKIFSGINKFQNDRNNAHDNKKISPMKFDLYSSHILAMNNAFRTLSYMLNSAHKNSSGLKKIIPENNREVIRLYELCRVMMKFTETTKHKLSNFQTKESFTIHNKNFKKMVLRALKLVPEKKQIQESFLLSNENHDRTRTVQTHENLLSI